MKRKCIYFIAIITLKVPNTYTKMILKIGENFTV